jgi:N6-L-threonylcarbamoyladenine synthase
VENAHVTILGIETSCDDTSAAVVVDGNVRSNIVSSQAIHNTYGGIVPELASREHIKGIGPIVQAALSEGGVSIEQVDAIAVTYGPGLAGSLLVGSHFAKGLALMHNKPLYPVHHIEAHLYSGYLEEPDLEFPSISLVVSGGHTSIFYVIDPTHYEVLGSTCDDAAGEAFDKVSKMLGLGYPGGPEIDARAAHGNPSAFDVPRGLINDGTYTFSFSGLKTSVRRTIEMLRAADEQDLPINDLCASVQEAIVDVLVHKTIRAAEEKGVRAVSISGGVSANSRLRARMRQAAESRNMRLVTPRLGYCVDNAAMIAHVAHMRIRFGVLPSDPSFTISPKALRTV